MGAYGSKKENSQVNRSNHISKDILSEKLEEKFWKVGIYKNLQKINTALLKPDQKRALNILKTATVLRNIRFKIGLLWKKENNVLRYNRDLAVKRLISLEIGFHKFKS